MRAELMNEVSRKFRLVASALFTAWADIAARLNAESFCLMKVIGGHL